MPGTGTFTKSKRLLELLDEGKEVLPLLRASFDTPLCTQQSLFENLSSLGHGLNGHVYLVPRRWSQEHFHSADPVVIKAITSASLQRHRDAPTLDDGKYICASPVVSEVLAGALLTRLVDHGLTPHLARELGVFGCRERTYIISEFCGYRLKDGRRRSLTLQFLNKVTAVTSNVVMETAFVMLHTLIVMQEALGVVHYDLKPDNILLTPITRNTTFNGHMLKQYTHFLYRFTDTQGKERSFYLPNRGYLLKLCDFGTTTATKVPQPNGAATSLMPRAVLSDNELRQTFGITAHFQPGYDAHFFLPQLWNLCQRWHIQAPDALKNLVLDHKLVISRDTHRPLVGAISEASPVELLETVKWEQFIATTPPENANIVVIDADNGARVQAGEE